jgi:hypothetical protein
MNNERGLVCSKCGGIFLLNLKWDAVGVYTCNDCYKKENTMFEVNHLYFIRKKGFGHGHTNYNSVVKIKILGKSEKVYTILNVQTDFTFNRLIEEFNKEQEIIEDLGLSSTMPKEKEIKPYHKDNPFLGKGDWTCSGHCDCGGAK